MSFVRILAGAVVTVVGATMLNKGSAKVAEAIVDNSKPTTKRLGDGCIGLLVTSIGAAAVAEGVKFAFSEDE